MPPFLKKTNKLQFRILMKTFESLKSDYLQQKFMSATTKLLHTINNVMKQNSKKILSIKLFLWPQLKTLEKKSFALINQSWDGLLYKKNAIISLHKLIEINVMKKGNASIKLKKKVSWCQDLFRNLSSCMKPNTQSSFLKKNVLPWMKRHDWAHIVFTWKFHGDM